MASIHVNASNTEIAGCFFDSVHDDGILVEDADNCAIRGCTFVDPGVSGSSDGVRLIGSSSDNHITGNMFRAATSTRYGVNVGTATCQSNVIVGNDFGGSANYTTGPFNDAGTGTVTTYTGGAVGDNVTY